MYSHFVAKHLLHKILSQTKHTFYMATFNKTMAW